MLTGSPPNLAIDEDMRRGQTAESGQHRFEQGCRWTPGPLAAVRSLCGFHPAVWSPTLTLQEQLTAVIRRKHCSRRTAWTCWAWIMASSRLRRGPFGWRHPSQMGAAEVEAFLTHLAVQRRVAAATENQALNGIVFLYSRVLELDPGAFNAARARGARRLPTVLSRREARTLVDRIEPPVRSIAEVMDSGGFSRSRHTQRQLRAFLRSAFWADRGATAAIEHPGRTLSDIAGAFLGEGDREPGQGTAPA